MTVAVLALAVISYLAMPPVVVRQANCAAELGLKAKTQGRPDLPYCRALTGAFARAVLPSTCG
jgi:hypothetical protein